MARTAKKTTVKPAAPMKTAKPRSAASVGRKAPVRKTKPAPTPAPVEQTPAPSTVAGKARSIIVAACSRPEGATSTELFDATGWKYASWSHQLKLAAKVTGWKNVIAKVDGVTHYYLREPA